MPTVRSILGQLRNTFACSNVQSAKRFETLDVMLDNQSRNTLPLRISCQVTHQASEKVEALLAFSGRTFVHKNKRLTTSTSRGGI